MYSKAQETTRLAGERVEIVQDGRVAWVSPDEWRVVDMAGGDPNDDGRYEILLSLRKIDPQGCERSHPFIVGYRGGRYKLLWGGSALSTPISEVELGDVGGDLSQELIVLEAFAYGANTLSTWRWHGWGHNLSWRIPPGQYANLRTAPTTGGGAVAVLVDIQP